MFLEPIPGWFPNDLEHIQVVEVVEDNIEVLAADSKPLEAAGVDGYAYRGDRPLLLR